MKERPSIEILISTMNRTDLLFLKTLFPRHEFKKMNLLIINQTKEKMLLHSDISNIRVINSSEFGLSKSRNLAIENAVGDILVIADDDIEYLPGFENIILKAYERHSKVSLIHFQFLNEVNSLAKIYPIKEGSINSSKYYLSSIEMTFRRKQLIDSGIRFDERFGLGARFVSNEEQIIKQQLLNRKLEVIYIPQPICIHSGLTSANISAHRKNTEAMAAYKYLIYGFGTYLWLVKYVLFLYRNKFIKGSEITKFYQFGSKAIGYMKNTANDNSSED